MKELDEYTEEELKAALDSAPEGGYDSYHFDTKEWLRQRVCLLYGKYHHTEISVKKPCGAVYYISETDFMKRIGLWMYPNEWEKSIAFHVDEISEMWQNKMVEREENEGG